MVRACALSIDWDGQILAIGVPNQFFLDWIRSNLRAAIEKTFFGRYWIARDCGVSHPRGSEERDRPVTAIAKRKPDFETIELPMPDSTTATAKIFVGYFNRQPKRCPGWYAEVRVGRINVHTAACRSREHAVLDAIDAIGNRLVDAIDRARARSSPASKRWPRPWKRGARILRSRPKRRRRPL